MKKRNGGWQMWVDEYDDHVIKTPRTKEEIKKKITKHLQKTGNLSKREEISNKLWSDFRSSIKIIKKSKLPLKYLAYPEFLENGAIKQKKVRTIGTILKEYSKEGKIKESKKLIDKFIKFTLRLWEYGIHEKPFKPTGNFGILGKDIVMIDFLELTSNKTKVQKKLHLKKDKLSRLFPEDRYDVRIREYVAEQVNKYLIKKNLDKCWKKKLKKLK